MRNLHARLTAVRRVDRAVQGVRKTFDATGRYLTRCEKRSCGSRRSGPADRALLEPSLNVRGSGEEHASVFEIATARPLGRVEELADTAGQPVVKDAKAGANHAPFAVGKGAADARLKVVPVAFGDVSRWVRLEIVAKSVREGQPRLRPPLILDKKSI